LCIVCSNDNIAQEDTSWLGGKRESFHVGLLFILMRVYF
jgi:hypothetical protein